MKPVLAVFAVFAAQCASASICHLNEEKVAKDGGSSVIQSAPFTLNTDNSDAGDISSYSANIGAEEADITLTKYGSIFVDFGGLSDPTFTGSIGLKSGDAQNKTPEISWASGVQTEVSAHERFSISCE